MEGDVVNDKLSNQWI